MNATELRELDTWIQKHIFEADLYVGLKKCGLWWRPNSCGYTSNQDEAGRYTRAEATKKAHPDDEPVTIHEFEPKHYTTDPAAAMEVLKRCLEVRTPSIMGGEFFVIEAKHINGTVIRVKHKSLETCICLFAKKILLDEQPPQIPPTPPPAISTAGRHATTQ